MTIRTEARNRRRGRLREAAFYAGHVIQYLGLLLMVGASLEEGRYLTYVGCGAQVAAAGALGRRSFRGWPAVPFAILMLYLLAQFVRGAVSGNWVQYLVLDTLAFGLLVSIPVGARTDVFRKTVRLYGSMIIAGCVAGVFLLARMGVGDLQERLVGDVDSSVFRLPTLLAPALVVVLVPEIVGRARFAGSVAALGITALFGLLTLTRFAVVIAAVGLLLMLWKQRRRPKWLAAAAIVAALGTGAASVRWTRTVLAEGIGALELRFTGPDISSGRDAEAEYLTRSLNPQEWIVGRGLGGSHFGPIRAHDTYGATLVHYGHLHLVLKGGLVLLALICALVLQALVSARGSSPSGKAAVAYLLAFVAMNAMHTQFMVGPVMGLFAVCVGQAIAGDKAERYCGGTVAPGRAPRRGWAQGTLGLVGAGGGERDEHAAD